MSHRIRIVVQGQRMDASFWVSSKYGYIHRHHWILRLVIAGGVHLGTKLEEALARTRQVDLVANSFWILFLVHTRHNLMSIATIPANTEDGWQYTRYCDARLRSTSFPTPPQSLSIIDKYGILSH